MKIGTSMINSIEVGMQEKDGCLENPIKEMKRTKETFINQCPSPTRNHKSHNIEVTILKIEVADHSLTIEGVEKAI